MYLMHPAPCAVGAPSSSVTDAEADQVGPGPIARYQPCALVAVRVSTGQAARRTQSRNCRLTRPQPEAVMRADEARSQKRTGHSRAVATGVAGRDLPDRLVIGS